MNKATAKAHANIAFSKYWGRLDHKLYLPLTTTNSLTLSECAATTTVEFSEEYERDTIVVKAPNLPGQELLAADGDKTAELFRTLAELRVEMGVKMFAHVESELSFPFKAGVASSAAGIAAFVAAVLAALGREDIVKDIPELSRRVRRASSVSAARSVVGGFGESLFGETDEAAYVQQIAPADHWELIDTVAVLGSEQKSVSSGQGHLLAETSPLLAGRIEDMREHDRPGIVRTAILARDFATLASESERDWLSMHAVMMTSEPGIFYLSPESWRIFYAVKAAREQQDLEAFVTFDAGANPHIISTAAAAPAVAKLLQGLGDMVKYTIVNKPGPGVSLLAKHLF